MVKSKIITEQEGQGRKEEEIPIPLHDLLLMFKASIHHYHNVLRADYLHISLPPTSLYLDIFSKTVYIYHVSFFIFSFRIFSST